MRRGKPELERASYRWKSRTMARGSALKVVARALRRLLFATLILLGLAFAVACWAEMLGVVQFD
jgi:hypothetical protein